MMISEKRIAFGIARWGFFTSSPVVEIASKPTKPKKHVAAPLIIPSMPNGKKPPAPTLNSAVALEGTIFQFLMSALRDPQMITNMTIAMFTAVNTLFIIADFFSPNASAARNGRKNAHHRYHLHGRIRRASLRVI